ncbi:hypothetical protein Vretimale_85 [Volvox reticuliferus]|uniref:Fungal lipase-type domain-containing protein n=1 Tax=Volvox reticuliferus TaxID=1737510 RepID=A0A8J4G2B1_9CHLO|nr:hypothetical protein Vretifemale_8417 [Volvox reticuliferus]GIL93783.1 hypothetical protein Vretimale_85 [Volvox reticuliferus]
MCVRTRLGELPRIVVLGCFLLFLIDGAVTLRSTSIDRIRLNRNENEATGDVFREVLSSQSTLYYGSMSSTADAITPLSTAEPLGDVELSTKARLRDPGIATVFSSRAARRLPRVAHGPSIYLTQRFGHRPGQGGAPEDAKALLQRKVDQDNIGTRTLPVEADRENQQQVKQQQLRLQDHVDQQQQQRPQLGKAELQRLQRLQPKFEAVDPPPPELDVDEALMAGRLASIAYCSHPDLLEAWNCSRCTSIPDFTPYRIVYDSVWDLAAYAGYYAPWDAVVLSFRGTDSSNWGQWAENMRAWRTDHMYPVPNFPHALIHAGFYTLWTGSMLQTTFTQAIADLMAAHPNARLVTTGHSMGGALAQLAGLEAKLFYNTTHTTVYTYGAPRVGNLAYQQLFNSFIDVSWRFTHNRDIVPSVPLQLMGFQHVAREVWEVDVEDPRYAGDGGVDRKLLLCDASGEDPSCHNSACYLGLCTSIADHLEYLGLHMYQDSDEC